MAEPEFVTAPGKLALRESAGLVCLPGLASRGLELRREIEEQASSSDLKDPLDHEFDASDFANYFLGKGFHADLSDKNIDRRAAAAKLTVEGLPKLGMAKWAFLIIPLADCFHTLFESQQWKVESGWYGREYFPPDKRLKDLILEALRSAAGDSSVADSVGAYYLAMASDFAPVSLDAAVWLAQNVRGFAHRLVRQMHDSSAQTRALASTALIKLGHRRRREAESCLLEALLKRTYYDDLRSELGFLDLVIGNLNRPESFLLAVCRLADPHWITPWNVMGVGSLGLVVEIIRRRGQDALSTLQEAREVSFGSSRRELADATYSILTQLEGSNWGGDDSMRIRIDPDSAWPWLMQRLERILHDVR